MVKISHYEVYTDRGDGWKLEDRFSSDQRYDAMRIAKEREAEKIAVKILKEDFDVPTLKRWNMSVWRARRTRAVPTIR